MIKEVKASQLVTYLARRSGKDSFSCPFDKLRKIGNYIEQHDQSIRVELGERYYNAFRSRSVRHIFIRESVIEIDGAKSPVVQSLFRQYAPNSQVVELIEQALEDIE